MKHAIKTDLYASKAPLEWAVVGNGTLYTAQIPIDAQGQVVAGGIEAQTRQTLDNLRHTLEAAGASLDAVTQVLIYVTDRSYLATVNSLYAEYFQPPYPNRAAVVVAGLAREEMLVELVVYACV
ncbi:RidA family protein [Pseudomonas sp. SWRI59]|uniref:RidA family protein n=1 Tax=Pseudomonas TaxID=286 RepID=UPI001644E57F|nr:MULTISPECIES: RidA family protein [unclassified Pseudomonas]MBC3482873.1 RidA family protein [Pseudomonas sp. SWRI77]MBC3504460.1 RidA family protein [Pseudomonas sp. SWRI59]MBC3509774.1 RidA family protein [Pseudomonas sp. SWRI68]MDD1960987.1 RidA family protein [Pseudomonas sp. 39004]UVL05910.1 RidA family protein [Pseudomonas sp. B21-047]